MDDQIGSIEVGKRADLVVIDLGAAHAEPGGDAVSRVVYACRAQDVRHVVLDGVIRVQDRALQDIDDETIVENARVQAVLTRARAGV